MGLLAFKLIIKSNMEISVLVIVISIDFIILAVTANKFFLHNVYSFNLECWDIFKPCFDLIRLKAIYIFFSAVILHFHHKYLLSYFIFGCLHFLIFYKVYYNYIVKLLIILIVYICSIFLLVHILFSVYQKYICKLQLFSPISYCIYQN